MIYNLHPESLIFCPCCGEGALTKPYLLGLRGLQERIGPDHILFMTSGFRCWCYNRSKKIGSGDYSYHPRGMAGDLTCPTLDVVDLFMAAQDVPEFKGLGIYADENFIHTDVRPDPLNFGYWKRFNAQTREYERIKMSKEDLSVFLTN